MDARDSVLLNHQIFEVDCPKIEFPPMDLWMPREIVLVIENTSGDSAICDLKLDHSHTLGQIDLDADVLQDGDWNAVDVQSQRM